MAHSIELTVQHDDILQVDADVVALKFAQSFYGADRAVAVALSGEEIPSSDLEPRPGDYVLSPTRGAIQAPWVLFVGVEPLHSFGYAEVRSFAARTLRILAAEGQRVRHLAMTIHGRGFGLDEVESFLAQIAGFFDAIDRGDVPPDLRRISIVEIVPSTADVLRRAMEQHLRNAARALPSPRGNGFQLLDEPSDPRRHDGSKPLSALDRAGRESANKPHAFVAMPFSDDMSDVYEYGIQLPIRSVDLLCERVDQHTFTGDILERIKQKIETATVVVADLTGANANVYLEVGYAWGKGIPTILVSRSADDLGFDVRGQRCLVYKNIKSLELALTKELTEFLATREAAGR